MKNRRTIGIVAAAVAAIVLAFGAASPARAGDAIQPRFTVVDGVVTIHGANGTASAGVGTPVFPGDYISTAPGTRAEIRLTDDAVVRLSGNVQAHIVDGSGQMQLASGTVELSMLRAGGGTAQIDTPSVTVRADQRGAFRVSILPNGQTQVVARRGSVVVVTPARSYPVDAGQAIVAGGTASNPTVAYSDAIAYDDFDQFYSDRDRTLLSEANPVPAADDYSASPWLPYGYFGGYYGFGGFYGAAYPYALAPVYAAAPGCVAPGFVSYVSYGFGASIGFGGLVGGCNLYYPALAYGGYYPWYGNGWYPGYWNPGGYYPPPPPPRVRVPITIVRRVPVRTHPVVTVANGPVSVPVAAAPVPAPVRVAPVVPVHARDAAPVHVAAVHVAPVRTASVRPTAIHRPVVAASTARRTETAETATWRRFDSARGTNVASKIELPAVPKVDPPAHIAVPVAHALSGEAWNRFSATRGAVSVGPDPGLRPTAPIGGAGPVGGLGGTRTSLPGSVGGGGSRISAPAPVSVPHISAPVGHIGGFSGGGGFHGGGGRPPR